MKIRHTLAALAAALTLTLTGCASETAGTAAAVAGADGVSSPSATGGEPTDGPTTQNDPTAPDTTTPDTTAPGTTEQDTSEQDTSDPAITPADTTTADTTAAATTEDSPAPGGNPGSGCAQLLTLAQDFSSKIIQKAAQGGVTQADVDDVFSDANMAALPPELQADAATLKDLSQQMVGKQITELGDILPKVQTTFRSIVEKAGSVC